MSAGRHGRTLAIGVDAGGTWVRAMALEDGRPLRRVRVPARRVPDLRSFVLGLGGGSRPAALVVASKGIWTPGERARLRRRLRGLARRVVVIPDVEAALLGALGDGPGLLILSGTGSIVLGRDARGRWARAGGLGPLLGDEGSAFWLGRAWLRLAAQAGDPASTLAGVRSPDAVRRVAALAPSVLRRARRGDRRARAIAAEAQEHLAAFAADVSRRLGLDTPVDVSWAGSVMADDAFRRGVARALARADLPARWHPPAVEPVEAAARLAAKLACRGRGRER
ncbi:MAG: hypothetical protein HYV94_09660 [Candidatus Rokubacteria bacterium]|nr:hypothetical protein [Candidatus Rokubacteria bacterium]